MMSQHYVFSMIFTRWGAERKRPGNGFITFCFNEKTSSATKKHHHIWHIHVLAWQWPWQMQWSIFKSIWKWTRAKHTTVRNAAITRGIYIYKLIISISNKTYTNTMSVLVITKYASWIWGSTITTCLPSIAPIQCGKFNFSNVAATSSHSSSELGVWIKRCKWSIN